MRTVIIGGGLIGLSTALALLDRGEEVLVLEAREAVGRETSFANGGMLTPSLSEPWNGPDVFGHLLKSLVNPSGGMKISPRAIPGLFRWGLGFIRNSVRSRFLAATIDNYRLARYSLDMTRAITRQFDLQYDFSDHGTLCIFRDSRSMQTRLELCQRLAEIGLNFSLLDPDEIVANEPTLAPIAGKLTAGIRLPDDACGDAHLFCRGLAKAIAKLGGEVRASTSASRLIVEHNRIVGVATALGEVPTKRVVVAAGSLSPQLLRSSGQTLAVRPAKGYSVTIEGSALGDLPNVAVVDEASHAVVTSFGSRLRVVGTAEFAGFDQSIPRERIDRLYNVLTSMLPDVVPQVDRDRAETWAGLRPMSNDGRPFIGPTKTEGLFVNTGHGALGWTMAVGSGYLLADQVVGRLPGIDHQAFLPARNG